MNIQIQIYPTAAIHILSILAHILRKQCPSFSYYLFLLIVPIDDLLTRDLCIEIHT